MVLIAAIIGYVLFSISIGLYASLRVRNSTDYLLAGRSLPIYMTIATVFATWFGSEAVLGIPATFLEEGLAGIVADPFGAGFCLIFVGLFFAARLYRMKLLTIGDFYRQRYGRAVELLVSIAICISYLGWVSAQIVAIGMVIHLVSAQAVGLPLAMGIGLFAVLLYTFFGGMWSVAFTDFMQMVIILAGLIAIAVLVAQRVDGGAMMIIQEASNQQKFDFWPSLDSAAILAFIGSFITLGLGSIPQQDVFQRVMSASNERVAVRGTVIGGSFYIIFCFIPVFITFGVTLLHPEVLAGFADGAVDTQRILPEFVLGHTLLIIQILFFGALISAIMSTASGTLLAPSALLAENILKPLLRLQDKGLLRASRLSMLTFGAVVYGYAYFSSQAGYSIFQMVENAYLVTLCGAFVPLAFGVYWPKASNGGALLSIILGVGTWITLEIAAARLTDGEGFLMPSQLAGLLMAVVGMILGSYIAPHRAAGQSVKV